MHQSHNERGMALISALLLLMIMTILGIAMFRTFGTQERIAGNTREKQRALHSADSAEAYAEWWLSSAGGINATAGSACGGLLSADTLKTQVCSNLLSAVVPSGDLTAVPWTNAGAETGVTYTPPGLTVGTGGTNTYMQIPRFYISYVNGTYSGLVQSSQYLIDATGWGGSSNSVAVVEASYVVSRLYTSSGSATLYKYQGGP
jgi:type IV pilus assembly protein PilX